MIRLHWASILDMVLGPKCQECGQRLYPNDRAAHYALDHAGDPIDRRWWDR